MAAPAPVKPPISKDLLEKVDIRVGTVRQVENITASKKLVRLLVNFGDHERPILAGLRRERAHPEELIGRQALFVVNLETKILAGERSEGMLLDIGSADGIVPVLAMPETPVPDGTRAG